MYVFAHAHRNIGVHTHENTHALMHAQMHSCTHLHVHTLYRTKSVLKMGYMSLITYNHKYETGLSGNTWEVKLFTYQR